MKSIATNQNRTVSFLRTENSSTTIYQPIIEKISKGDNLAINECLSVYGNKIWALVSNFISEEYIEDVTRMIFLDIWKNAKNYNATKYSEEEFIKLIAVRRIMKFKRSI